MKMLGRIVADDNGQVDRVDRIELLEHEFEALLAALRRDMHHEQEHSGGEDGIWHGYNARMDVRLLETLQPKRVVHQTLVLSISMTASVVVQQTTVLPSASAA
jgi:hypothetical protein